MNKCLIIFIVTLLCAPTLVYGQNAAGKTTIFEGDSVYTRIIIRDNSSTERCMYFEMPNRLGRETCMDLTNRDRHIFEYTSMMFVGFVLQPQSKRVALIGLGGGMIPGVFYDHLPGVKLDVAEIDPLVVKLAHKYFGFKASKNIGLKIQDGRNFIRWTKKNFDQIWVDAFNGNYIPPHLTTKEFMLECKKKLSSKGLLLLNVHSTNRLFLAHVATARKAFRHVWVFSGQHTGNAIIIASDQPLIKTKNQLIKQAIKSTFKIPGISLTTEADKYSEKINTRKAPVLTDDFSPVNLLKTQEVD